MIEQNRYKKLYEDITNHKGKPLSHWELTALLEIHGLRDIDAQNDWESENLFDLAKKLQHFIQNYEYEEKELSKEEIIPILPRVIKNYTRGLAFALPMLIQTLATIFIGYSLWSSTQIDMASATAIAIGSFTALIVTGGIAQIIGRQGLYYIKVSQYVLASKVIDKFYKLGIKKIILVAIILSIMHFVFEFIPFYMYFLAITFYLLLSILYLNFSIYYALEDYRNIVLFTFVGVILVYFLYRVFNFGLIPSQISGIIILNIIIYLFSKRKLRKMEKIDPEAEDVTLPKDVVLFHTLAPFFTYGFLYFLFLVMDRFIAWSVNVGDNPYMIWFNLRYELGLDWALIALVFMMGVTEISISELLIRINGATKHYKHNEIEIFNKRIIYFFNKFNIIFLTFGIFVILLSFGIIYTLAIQYDNDSLNNMLLHPTPILFFVASVAYLFLVKGLMNILLIFSFSRPQYAVQAIFYGVLVNMGIGLIFSRLLGYEFTVLGLLAGAIVFWYFSRKSIKRLLANLDYFYYSAYY